MKEKEIQENLLEKKRNRRELVESKKKLAYFL